ncbi:solute carrier family 29 (equilibrative nucleoside transporter), member 1/2/3 [Malassezia restricta]|nr:solute carrier family 29 (equilibrative nucleoside transporter), member 1/2/3 [Malassezia restricta]AXA51217.1 solute carrier family 29 (equilibrative nucleoside transporter), member 1/2/3 [Malassezia restricta]
MTDAECDISQTRPRMLVPVTAALLGMCVLAPFNALVSSIEYFHDAFRLTPLESVFSSGIMTVFNATAVVCAVTALFPQGTKRFMVMKRIQIMLVASMALSSVVIVSIWIRGNDAPRNPTLYYIILLVMSIALALVQTYLQNATMAFCTSLDIHGYVTGYMLLGQALNGVFGSVLNLASSMSASKISHEAVAQNKRSALTVYVSTALLQLVTWWAFRRMLRAPLIKQRMEGWTQVEHDRQGPDMSWTRIKRVQASLVPWSASIFVLFAVTLCVYPGITSRVRTTTQSAWLQNEGVFVALHIVCMNIGDLMGRRLPIIFPATNVRRVSVAIACTAARILFLPFFLMCHLGKHVSSPIPDSLFFLCVWGIGLTSGWLSTSLLICGPQSVNTAHPHGERNILLQQEDSYEIPATERTAAQDATVASMLLSFWIVSGLTAGGALSLLVNILLG